MFCSSGSGRKEPEYLSKLQEKNIAFIQQISDLSLSSEYSKPYLINTVLSL